MATPFQNRLRKRRMPDPSDQIIAAPRIASLRQRYRTFTTNSCLRQNSAADMPDLSQAVTMVAFCSEEKYLRPLQDTHAFLINSSIVGCLPLRLNYKNNQLVCGNFFWLACRRQEIENC
jgi:hypothetical protein